MIHCVVKCDLHNAVVIKVLIAAQFNNGHHRLLYVDTETGPWKRVRGHAPVRDTFQAHRARYQRRTFSHIEQDIQHIAVLYEVLLALASQHTPLSRFCNAAALGEIIVADNLGPDESSLEVGVDLPGRG